MDGRAFFFRGGNGHGGVTNMRCRGPIVWHDKKGHSFENSGSLYLTEMPKSLKNQQRKIPIPC